MCNSWQMTKLRLSGEYSCITSGIKSKITLIISILGVVFLFSCLRIMSPYTFARLQDYFRKLNPYTHLMSSSRHPWIDYHYDFSGFQRRVRNNYVSRSPLRPLICSFAYEKVNVSAFSSLHRLNCIWIPLKRRRAILIHSAGAFSAFCDMQFSHFVSIRSLILYMDIKIFETWRTPTMY